ncbi:proclotting enzyme-like [Periplaneta americana]|uniref:proclotting enzyme-like n=1 Tax=Periplaneta americana TaxID=6978 RepID=UPI0037E96E51
MALITGNNTPACGGAVISDQYVATAAHCTTLRYRQEELKVVLGEHNHCEPDNRTSSFSVLRMIVHPLFNASTYAFDIMLLKLSMRLTFNEIVRPICLPQWGQLVSTPLREQEGTALGWGVLAFQSPFKTCELRQVELLLIPRAQCLVQSSYTPEMLPPTLFCAGFPQGGKDSCQGDSGGPLQVMNSQGRYELLGIISNGISCAHPAFPGKYTNVPLFTAWIIANTQDSNYCTN